MWDAKPDLKFHGHITRLPSTVITYGTRNVGEVLVSIEDSNGVLLPNTNVVVTVTTHQVHNALTVPREALHIEGGRDYVYVVARGTLRRVPVEVGAINLTMVQISERPPGTYGGRPGHNEWRADLRGCSGSHRQLDEAHLPVRVTEYGFPDGARRCAGTGLLLHRGRPGPAE